MTNASSNIMNNNNYTGNEFLTDYVGKIKLRVNYDSTADGIINVGNKRKYYRKYLRQNSLQNNKIDRKKAKAENRIKIGKKIKKKIIAFVFYLFAISLISFLSISIYSNFEEKRNNIKKEHNFLVESFNLNREIADDVYNYPKIYGLATKNDEITVKEISDQIVLIDESIEKLDERENDIKNVRYVENFNSRDKLIDYNKDNKNFLLKLRSFWDYEKKVKNINIHLYNEKDSLRVNYFTANNLEDLKHKIASFKDSVDFKLEEINNIEAPKGLEEYHSTNVNYLTKFSTIANGLQTGLAAALIQDEDQEVSYNKSIDLYNEFIEDTSDQEKMSELMNYYILNLDGEYNELAEKQDELKTDLILSSIKLNVNPKEVNL